MRRPEHEPAPGGSGAIGGAVRRVTRLSEGAPLLPVGVLFGLNLVDELDRIAFATLTPEIRDSFGLSDTGIASVAVITGLFLLFAALPIGMAADRRNRVRMATVAGLLWGTMSVLTGVVPTLVLLVLVRFLSGLGRAINDVVHPSLLADLYRPDDQTPAFSLHKLANPISAAAALLAGGIAATLGWRWAFVLMALPTVPLLVALHRIPEPARGRWSDDVGATPSEASSSPAPSLWQGLRLMAAVRTLRRLWLGAFVVGVAAVPAAVFMTLFFEQEYGFGPVARGFVQVVLGVGGTAGLLLAGRLAPRSGEVEAETPALAVHLAGWLAVGGVGILSVALVPVAALGVASLAFVGAGMSGLQPVLLALVARVTPARCRALSFGITTVFVGLGAICSLALFGMGESNGYRPALVGAGVLTLAAAAVARSARPLVLADLDDPSTKASANRP